MRPLSVKSRLVVHGVPSPQSPWHSPVPYLFGGLAAMIGLIAFALLILACSYWRLSSSSGEDNGGGGDEEKERRPGDKAGGVYEDKFLVIMAGDDLPRFLATPAVRQCTCGEGKMVISQEDNVAEEEKESTREGEEGKVKENGETTSTTH